MSGIAWKSLDSDGLAVPPSSVKVLLLGQSPSAGTRCGRSTDKQIKLLETFADQAVTAIENVRLFKELQARNAELREALEHQTATAEVLGIISRSPTDVEPVLDAIVESAARVCGIDDVLLRMFEGNVSVPPSSFCFDLLPGSRRNQISMEPQYRWMRQHGALHIPYVRATTISTGFPRLNLLILSWPFLFFQQGELIGGCSHQPPATAARPFTPAQMKLLYVCRPGRSLSRLRTSGSLKNSKRAIATSPTRRR